MCRPFQPDRPWSRQSRLTLKFGEVVWKNPLLTYKSVKAACSGAGRDTSNISGPVSAAAQISTRMARFTAVLPEWVWIRCLASRHNPHLRPT